MNFLYRIRDLDFFKGEVGFGTKHAEAGALEPIFFKRRYREADFF
jgi:hypothetical protein